MRLIDADNAIHALGVFSDVEHGNKHFLNGINSAKEIINECVTIDAVPVVRGEWIHGCTDGAGTEFCYCSACDEDALKDKGGYTEFSRYCPNCGAKMDGEKEGV